MSCASDLSSIACAGPGSGACGLGAGVLRPRIYKAVVVGRGAGICRSPEGHGLGQTQALVSRTAGGVPDTGAGPALPRTHMS